GSMWLTTCVAKSFACGQVTKAVAQHSQASRHTYSVTRVNRVNRTDNCGTAIHKWMVNSAASGVFDTVTLLKGARPRRQPFRQRLAMVYIVHQLPLRCPEPRKFTMTLPAARTGSGVTR